MKTKGIKDAVDKGLGWLLVFLMGVAVVNVLWQVFTRFVMDAPSSFTEELARFLLVWIGILGAGYATGQRVHLALELLPERLEGHRLARLNIVIEGLVLLFALVVMVGGGFRLVYVLVASGQTSPSLDVLMGYVYAVVPLSGLLIVFYSVVHIADELRTLTDPSARQADDEPEAAKTEDLHVD